MQRPADRGHLGGHGSRQPDCSTRRPLDPRAAVALPRARSAAALDPHGPCGTGPAAHRVLLHPAVRRGQAGVRPVRLRRVRLRQQLGRLEGGLRRMAAGGRDDHHVGDRAGHRGAGGDRHRALPHRAVPAPPAPAADDPRRAAGRGAFGRIRAVGHQGAGAEAAGARAVGVGQALVPAAGRRDRLDSQLLRGRADPGHHDPADRLGDLAGGHADRARAGQGGRAVAGRHAVGDDPDGRAALLARRNLGRGDAGPGPRDRRDDRGDDRDRQRAQRPRVDLQPGLHAGRGGGQRVQRGGLRSDAPRRAHRRRPRALRAHAAGQRARALLRQPRRARRARRSPGDGGMTTLPALSRRRRAVDRTMRGLMLVLTVTAVVPLVLIVYYQIKEGIGAWSQAFFTTDPTGRFLGDPGGIRSAIFGTIEMVALASLIAIPFGVGVALYLVEYGKGGRFANTVRYFVDVMTGVPSVVFGLFVYIVLVVTKVGGTFAGWKGAVALALLMLPVVTRSAEVVLNLVPDSLREAALALGAPRWKVIFRIVLPTALPGIVTGSLLAVARAAGETAPLLFTAAFVLGVNTDLSQRMNSLPLQIFNDVGQAQDRLVQRAWGAALTLVLMVLALTLIARLIQRRSKLAA